MQNKNEIRAPQKMYWTIMAPFQCLQSDNSDRSETARFEYNSKVRP